jgi:hypothetical protein
MAAQDGEEAPGTSFALSLAPVEPMKDKPKAGVRERLASDASDDYERIKAAIWAAIDADKEQWTTCTHCNKRTRVTIADFTARIRAVELALEQGLGKVPQQPAASNSIEALAKRTQERFALHEMTDQELEALIEWERQKDPEGAAKDDAEWEAWLKSRLEKVPAR